MSGEGHRKPHPRRAPDRATMLRIASDYADGTLSVDLGRRYGVTSGTICTWTKAVLGITETLTPDIAARVLDEHLGC